MSSEEQRGIQSSTLPSIRIKDVRWMAAVNGSHRAAILSIALVLATIAACDPARPNRATQIATNTGGDAERSRSKIHEYGCHTCHMTPGVDGAEALVELAAQETERLV